jgi:hypothetical protein
MGSIDSKGFRPMTPLEKEKSRRGSHLHICDRCGEFWRCWVPNGARFYAVEPDDRPHNASKKHHNHVDDCLRWPMNNDLPGEVY